jgi:hypothetical protein
VRKARFDMPQVFRRRIKYRDKDGNEVSRKTGNYYARFQIEGQDYCITTGKTTEREAKAELERLMASYREQTTLATQFKALREAKNDEPKHSIIFGATGRPRY